MISKTFKSKKMADPWERPPFPKKGNRSQRVLFSAMGAALNAWEEVEVSLAHLYAALVTGDRFDPTASHAYGVPLNFSTRYAGLQTAAQDHFSRNPSQMIEGEFCRLMRLVTGYSARRNDIAHSHALHIHWVRNPLAPETLLSSDADLSWCLVPPFFKANKFTSENRPAYVFTSLEMNEYCDVFWDIARALSNLSIWAIQHVPASHYIRPQPSALPYKVRAPPIRRG
jgi:hypothetical protein